MGILEEMVSLENARFQMQKLWRVSLDLYNTTCSSDEHALGAQVVVQVGMVVVVVVVVMVVVVMAVMMAVMMESSSSISIELWSRREDCGRGDGGSGGVGCCRGGVLRRSRSSKDE